jgi:hypothetical protein
MQWCLSSSSVRQKSFVKVEHVQEATELADSFRRKAALVLPAVGNPRRKLCNRGRWPLMLWRHISSGWLGSRASGPGRRESLDFARALRETRRIRGCHPIKRSRSWVPTRRRPWSAEMFARRCVGHTEKLEEAKSSGDGGLLDIAKMDGNLDMFEPDRFWRSSGNQRFYENSHECGRQDNGLEWYGRLELYSYRSDANRYSSWTLCGVR